MKMGVSYVSPTALRWLRQTFEISLRQRSNTFSLRIRIFLTLEGWVPEMSVMSWEKVFSQSILGIRGSCPELLRFSSSQRTSFSVLLIQRKSASGNPTRVMLTLMCMSCSWSCSDSMRMCLMGLKGTSLLTSKKSSWVFIIILFMMFLSYWITIFQLSLYLSDNFYQQMNEELKRIRQKDYSLIDQTLFENIARTDNISSTLSHLTDFQQFLMQQIKLLNHPQKSNEASLASSINKNFDTLRESLVNCSRIRTQNEDKSRAATVKKTLSEVRQSVLTTKVQIKTEVKAMCKQAQQMAQDALKQVISVLQEERVARKALQQKCKILEAEKATLLKENEELKKDKKADNMDSYRSANQKQNSNPRNDSSAQSSTMLDRKVSEQRLVLPLTQQRPSNYGHNSLNSIPSFSEKDWKIHREDFIRLERGADQRRNSLSRQTSNHKLTSKQNLQLMRENQILLSKGVRDERRKSKQKIKIFSLM